MPRIFCSVSTVWESRYKFNSHTPCDIVFITIDPTKSNRSHCWLYLINVTIFISNLFRCISLSRQHSCDIEKFFHVSIFSCFFCLFCKLFHMLLTRHLTSLYFVLYALFSLVISNFVRAFNNFSIRIFLTSIASRVVCLIPAFNFILFSTNTFLQWCYKSLLHHSPLVFNRSSFDYLYLFGSCFVVHTGVILFSLGSFVDF